MLLSVDLLVERGERYLDDRGYAKFTKWEYRKPWREFAAACRAAGNECPSREDADVFAVGRGWGGAGCSVREKRYRNSLQRLFDVEECGAFQLRSGSVRALPPPRWGWALEEYLSQLKSAGAAEATVWSKRVMLTRFLSFLHDLGIDDFALLCVCHVQRFVATAGGAEFTRVGYLYFLRTYLRFVVERHGADPALAGMFPVIRVHRDAVLPSVYSADEVRRVVAAASEGQAGRRGRAVVLLAALVGMRVSDIKGLMFDQIDWAGRSVSFAQVKTGVRVDLPLPDECVFALLDYLRQERPVCDDPHVFVRSRAPFGPFSSTYVFHGIITACFARAGVDVAGRHHGAHAFRHSAAVNMLLSDSGYPVIAGVLGHASTNTTRRYLRVDVEHLRPLSLEVPDGR